MKIVIVGCGRVGASVAELYDRAGHEVIILDSSTSAFDRLPSSFGGTRTPRRRHGRGRPAPGRRRGRRRLPGPDRGRQPQHHGRPAGQRGARHRHGSSPRSTTRCGRQAYAELGIATLCRTGLMARRRQRLPRPAGLGPAGHARPDRPPRRHRSTSPIGPSTDGTPGLADATHRDPGGLSRVRARRRRGEGRLLPRQGAHRIRPRGRAHGEGPRRAPGRSPTRSARSSSPTTAARASTSARPAATGPTSWRRSPATTRTTSSSARWPSTTSTCRGRSPGSTTPRTRRSSGISAWTS